MAGTDPVVRSEPVAQKYSTDVIRRRFEMKIAETKAVGHLTVPNAELLVSAASGSAKKELAAADAERPHSGLTTERERQAYAHSGKAASRAANEQSTDGVHENAVKDPDNFCAVCGKRVYPLEKVTAHKGVYHKTCFRCGVCSKTLTAGNFSVLEGHVFCKPHLIQQFKTRGKYETSAAFKAGNTGGLQTAEKQ